MFNDRPSKGFIFKFCIIDSSEFVKCSEVCSRPQNYKNLRVKKNLIKIIRPWVLAIYVLIPPFPLPSF